MKFINRTIKNSRHFPNTPFDPQRHLFAFTLIELLLVSVVLALITGLAVPNIKPAYDHLQLQRTVEDLADTMRYAQSRAVASNSSVRLEFDEKLSSFWLTQEGDADKGGGGKYGKIKGRLGRVINIAKGISLESSEEKPCVQFYPDGTIDKIQVYICQKKKCFAVSTQEQRGYVNVFEVIKN